MVVVFLKKYGCRNNRIYFALNPTNEVVVVHLMFLADLSTRLYSQRLAFRHAEYKPLEIIKASVAEAIDKRK